MSDICADKISGGSKIANCLRRSMFNYFRLYFHFTTEGNAHSARVSPRKNQPKWRQLYYASIPAVRCFLLAV
jgi:hypothetical protein